MSDTSAPSAAISVRPTTPTMKWLGKTCPKCQKEIAVGDQVVLCPKCYTPQHAQCWRDNGNQCAVDSTPARIIEPRGRPAGAAASPTPSADTSPATAPTASPATSAAAAPAEVAAGMQAAATGTATPAAPAARPAAAAVAAPAPTAAGELANPWRYAQPLNPPPETDLWRRNIMTVFWIVVIWAIFVAIAYFSGFAPGRV